VKKGPDAESEAELTLLGTLSSEAFKELMHLRMAVPEGTFPPGSTVRKSRMRDGDYHQVGALAKTMSFPLGPVEHNGRQVYGYFVEWADLPGKMVFVAGDVLELVARPS